MTSPSHREAWSLNDGKLLLTVPEAAARMGIGRSLLYSLVMRGEIRSVTIGRARRIPAAALDEFVAELQETYRD